MPSDSSPDSPRHPANAFAAGHAARLLAQMSDAYVAMDRDLRVLAVNPAAERVLGIPGEALIGRTHWELFPASAGAEPERRYRRVARDGVEEHFTYRYAGEGYDSHIEVDAYPTEEGGVAVFWRDVTERVRTEQALERQSRLTRLVADNATSALFVMDRDGHPTYMNPAAAAMTGYTLDEIRWMPLHYAVHHHRPDGSPYPMADCPIDRALPENSDVRAHEDVFVRKDGSFFPVLCAASPILEDGVPVGTVVEVRDVTAERRAAAALRELNAALAERNAQLEAQEQELELSNRQLQRAVTEAERARRDAQTANRAKSDFLATMSHEIRTPINAIQGYAQLLDLGLGGPVTAQQHSYLERLSTSSQHLLGLVDDVLDLAKVEAGELLVAREQATTARAIGAALDLVGPQAGARGVRLVDGPSAAPGSSVEGTGYVGDEHRVRQVLVNLLSNAVKFTDPGGTVRVTFGRAAAPPAGAGVPPGGPWTFIRVADTGVGIDPEQQAAVFEPFHQLEGGHTRTRGGTGLGLAISRRLARLMGGDVTLESAPGEGSTFTLWLPAAEHTSTAEMEVFTATAVRVPRGAPAVARSLGELGEALRGEIDAVLGAYAQRLRTDPLTPLARTMGRAALEDHAVTLLADLAQSLIIVGEAGDEAAALMRDGSGIQRVMADHHGARRHAQGWTADALRRDYQVLREIMEQAVVRRLGEGGDVSAREPLRVLLGLVDRAEQLGVRAWQRAARAESSAAARAGNDDRAGK